MPKPDPEELTEREIEREAAMAERDPVTEREAFEEELMEEGESDEGEHIGEHID
jgi:hypothetical protein